MIITVGSSRAVELSAATLPNSSVYVMAFPVSMSGGTGGPFGPLPLPPNAPGSCCGELRGGSEIIDDQMIVYILCIIYLNKEKKK